MPVVKNTVVDSARVTAQGEARSHGYIVKLALVTALSGLLFGFDTAVINGALVYLQRQFQLSVWETEVAASSLLLGAILGAAAVGWLSDSYGRRRILSISALIFACSAVGSALAQSLSQFALLRCLGGIAIGAGSVLAPLYLTEISPAEKRGKIVTINQLAIVSGILIAYFTNWVLARSGPDNWRWMFGVGAVPALALWYGLSFVPESPRWLIQRKEESRAEQILQLFGTAEAARREIQEVREALLEERSWKHSLWAKPLRNRMLIAIALTVFSQVTGINTVLYYGSIIFQQRFASQNASSSIGINVLIGIVNLLFTVAALLTIDRLGRRLLFLLASGGMAVSLLFIAACFFARQPSTVPVVLSIVTYVAFFSFGMAPALWVYISEIFPNAVRGRAVSVATVSLWSATLLVTLTFLSLVKRFGISGTFLIYAGFSLLCFIFVWLMVHETRRKTLEEIQQMWR